MKTNNNNSQATTKPASGLKNRTEQPRQAAPQADRPPIGGIDYAQRFLNRALPTDKLLDLLKVEAPDFVPLAEVIGKWVWITFPDKQPREVTSVLAQLGFHWNNKRQAWQHPCGTPRKQPSSQDPRERYGSEKAAA